MNAAAQQQTSAGTSLASIKQQQGAVGTPAVPDQAFDLFTERGFALAQRVARALASSNAVPAQFQAQIVKKFRRGDDWVEELVENPNAIANCIVAMDVSRTVGMSVIAVMQNADMIEGKLRWSGKFVIAAINASGRFTPLRFQKKNLGRIKATYREKGAYNKAKRGYDFTEQEIEIDNEECIAWALPYGYQEPRVDLATMKEYRGRMLDLYEDMGLPVIKSAPVTMELVVQEGWYSKPGSKWQTGMKDLMFQYRTGSFFGNIHAPDIVMGMGQTSEEARDLAPTFELQPDGTVTPTNINDLRAPATGPAPKADVVDATPAQKTASHQTGNPPFDVAAFIARVRSCADMETIEVLSDEAEALPNGPDRDAAMQALVIRDGELTQASVAAKAGGSKPTRDPGGDPRDALEEEAQQSAPPTARRRTAAPATNVE